MKVLRQFLTRAILIDLVIYRDLWDKYVRRVPKRRISRPAKATGLQAWVDRKFADET